MLQNTLKLFSHYCILVWFYLCKVFKTTRRSYYTRRASSRQTNLILLMKMNNVTSNVSRAKSSEKNKLEIFMTSSPYIVHIQIHSSGTSSFRNKYKDKHSKRWNSIGLRAAKILLFIPLIFYANFFT